MKIIKHSDAHLILQYRGVVNVLMSFAREFVLDDKLLMITSKLAFALATDTHSLSISTHVVQKQSFCYLNPVKLSLEAGGTL